MQACLVRNQELLADATGPSRPAAGRAGPLHLAQHLRLRRHAPDERQPGRAGRRGGQGGVPGPPVPAAPWGRCASIRAAPTSWRSSSRRSTRSGGWTSRCSCRDRPPTPPSPPTGTRSPAISPVRPGTASRTASADLAGFPLEEHVAVLQTCLDITGAADLPASFPVSAPPRPRTLREPRPPGLRDVRPGRRAACRGTARPRRRPGERGARRRRPARIRPVGLDGRGHLPRPRPRPGRTPPRRPADRHRRTGRLPVGAVRQHRCPRPLDRRPGVSWTPPSSSPPSPPSRPSTAGCAAAWTPSAPSSGSVRPSTR